MATSGGGPPIEYYIEDRPASLAHLEHACRIATGRADRTVTALAVDPASVGAAADLLFGTGIGVVVSLRADAVADITNQARLCVASGAAEIAIGGLVLDEVAVLHDLKSFLGSSTPLTVDVTSQSGDVDLDAAEHALVLGAEYVAYRPPPDAVGASAQLGNLLQLAGELQLGGVKLAPTSDHHQIALLGHPWSADASRTRLCLPCPPPEASPTTP